MTNEELEERVAKLETRLGYLQMTLAPMGGPLSDGTGPIPDPEFYVGETVTWSPDGKERMNAVISKIEWNNDFRHWEYLITLENGNRGWRAAQSLKPRGTLDGIGPWEIGCGKGWRRYFKDSIVDAVSISDTHVWAHHGNFGDHRPAGASAERWAGVELAELQAGLDALLLHEKLQPMTEQEFELEVKRIAWGPVRMGDIVEVEGIKEPCFVCYTEEHQVMVANCRTKDISYPKLTETRVKTLFRPDLGEHL